MQKQKKNTFAIIAGILLIVSCLYSTFIVLQDTFLNIFRYHVPIRYMLSSVLNIAEPILVILAGVFLILENRKAASAMKFAYAGVYCISAAIFLISGIRYHYVTWETVVLELLAIAAAVLLAVALLRRGQTAMVLAIVGGGLCLAALILSFLFYRSIRLFHVFRLLIAAGYVLAGLYLKDAPPLNAPRAPYAPAGYYPPQSGYYPPQPQQGGYPPQGYYPPQPQGYYPQQPQQGYFPQQPRQGYYPQQPAQGYYPQQSQQGGYPQQPGYYPPQPQQPPQDPNRQ